MAGLSGSRGAFPVAKGVVGPLQLPSMRLLRLLLTTGGCSALLYAGDHDAVLQQMDTQAAHFSSIAQQIWEFAEVGYKETQSAALLKAELQGAGFTITDNIGSIPTAFSASYGSGKPVIAILGEYDALPGLEQQAVPMKKPIKATKPGHGCGHNLFGAASAFAAITVKRWLEQTQQAGTVRFYGCPAEEGGSGKIYMLRAGAFEDCDIALHWHPGTENRASLKGNLGNLTGKFQFNGLPAHAAASPHKGRSALDAVMLFTHAVELLREHVPQTTRMHYIITSGGDAPNVVPPFAEVYLYLRSPEMTTLDDAWPRILKCADGAALATETTFNLEIVSSAYTMLPNDALAKLLDKNLHVVGGVSYSDEEYAFARQLRTTLPAEGLPGLESAAEVIKPEEGIGYGSTDVSDVSWVVPTGGFSTATFVPGSPTHSWQSTACAGTSIGHKGMVNAAKVLVLSALDLLTQPELVQAAKTSFSQRKAGKEYKSRLPADQKPPLNYRDEK